ncbi:MAG: site-specific DNA-methyltransferase [Candidatus Bathyarchaeota archaeon]|nr:site-specific DNA-methyltransferase [Candidatus Bathyarchaeota archaeon]
MVTKKLKKKEVELGFIQIPSKDRRHLFAESTLPLETRVNGYPAKVDKNARLWCREYLKSKFPVDTEVTLTRNETGFHVMPKTATQETEKNINEQNVVAPLGVKSEPVLISSDVSGLNETWYKVIQGDCLKYLNSEAIGDVHVTFFDPPYLQGKAYRFFDDNQSDGKYWDWVKSIVEGVYNVTADGGAMYFMHREKNAERVLRILRKAGWTFQNLIIWRKMTSAVPIEKRFSKQYQIIVYAIKGEKPRVFNKLRIDPPPLPWHKWQHEEGVFLTDVWDDIRELTSGYFAGEEALRDKDGNRMHIQQTPVALLLRIILSSTLPGDVVLDPTAGTGTALVVAKQLARSSVGIEIDPLNIELIKKRLTNVREADDVSRYFEYYKFTSNLKQIWPLEKPDLKQQKLL